MVLVDPWHVLMAIYVILNIAAFSMYGIDKNRAVRVERRISESSLLSVSLVGAFGAAAGMRVFRHKTRKPLFKLVYLFLALNIAVIVLISAGPII